MWLVLVKLKMLESPVIACFFPEAVKRQEKRGCSIYPILVQEGLEKLLCRHTLVQLLKGNRPEGVCIQILTAVEDGALCAGASSG